MSTYKTTNELKHAFSLKQQTQYGTSLQDADIDKSHSTTDDSTVEFKTKKFTNAEEFGKGHGHATEVTTMSADTRVSLNFRCSSWIAGYLFALCCGEVATNELVVGTVYEHVFTLRQGTVLPVTSIIEQLADGMQTKYRDMLCQGVTISGKHEEHITAQATFIGSGHRESVTVTMPGFVTTSFPLFENVTFSIGVQDYSAELDDVSFGITNTVNEKGYHPQSPKMDTPGGKKIACRGRMMKNGETLELKFKMLYKDDSIDTDALENNERQITLTAVGDPIDETHNHELKIEAPKAVIEAAPIGKDDKYYVYDCTTILKWDNSIPGPIKITLKNDMPEYLALPS